jgi:hypothetical protein
VDLLLGVSGTTFAVIEVKVLSGLGPKQLNRYETAFPHAGHRLVIFPSALIVDLSGQPAWQALTWEDVLGFFATSADPWVAQTAQAWREHLSSSLPAVGGPTRWNDIPDRYHPEISLRVRLSWVFGQLRPPRGITHDLVTSSAGNSAVVRVYRRAAKDGYRVIAEVEENLPVRDYPRNLHVRDYPKTAHEFSQRLRGPSVKVCLMQENVDTSAGFDWDYLLQLWRLMEPARHDWVTTPAQPKAPHDRAAWEAMIAKGGPRHLGIGFGEAQARRRGECMFGARFQLPADVDLNTVVETMHQAAQLVHRLATTPPATHDTLRRPSG